MNSSFPFTRSGDSSRPQAASASSAASETGQRGTCEPRGASAANPIKTARTEERPGARRSASSPREAAITAFGHALPAVAGARQVGQRRGGGRPARLVERQPAHELVRDLVHGARTALELEQRPEVLVDALPAGRPSPRRARSATPTAVARHRRPPRRRPSRTPPGRCWAPPAPRRRAGGSGRSECSRRPVKCTRAAASGRRGEPALALLPAEPVEERGQVVSSPSGRPRARGPRRATSRAASRSPLRDRGEQPLQAVAVLAEPDHAQARVGHGRDHERPRGEQQVHALRHDQLADVGHDPVARGVERAQRGGRALVAAPTRGGRALEAVRQRAQPGAASARGRGRNACTSTPGGPEPGPVGQRRVVERRPQALAGVARAHQHAGSPVEPLARQRQEALRVRLDRVLERAAVDLHRVAGARPAPARRAP